MKFHKLVSYLFHPILAPIITTIMFFIILPRHTSRTIEITIITAVFITTYVLPLIILSILKKANIISSFQLSNIKERKYPLFFFISMTYLMGTLVKNNDTTVDLALFFYGSSISLFIVILLLYKNIKISLHTTGIAGMLTFITIFSYVYQINNLLIISTLFILSGIVASSRLSLKAHNTREVYFGFFIGIIGQCFVYFFYNI